MPIAANALGRAATKATPFVRSITNGLSFRRTVFSTKNEQIVGVSRDSAGAALGSCVVKLFRTTNDALAAQVTSDASGNFTFNNPGSGPFYIVCYKAGSPDVSGTGLNTIVAV